MSRLSWLTMIPLLPLAAACSTGVPGGPAVAAILADSTLRPAVVTERVLHDSDDPAIWVNPGEPAGSLVLGTDKGEDNGGIYVFGLDGRIDTARTAMGLQRMNNVDVEYGLMVGGRPVDIAVATERRRMMLRVFALPEMRPIDGGGLLVFEGDTAREPMGVALYRRPSDGAVFAIVGAKAGPTSGYLWQYRLEDGGNGQVRATKVREFGNFSGVKEIEAIAVDDELGYVYYSDETQGIRKYHADPDKGDAELAFFGTTGFSRDHEGMSVYRREDGTGYLVASDQGGQRLQIFPREGTDGNPHHHPAIAVVPTSALETDGIAVTSQALGPTFPNGLLAAMSDDGTFHLYRWEDLQAAIDQVEARRAATPSP